MILFPSDEERLKMRSSEQNNDHGQDMMQVQESIM